MAHIKANQLPPEGMQHALQQIHTSLMALKAHEDTGGIGSVQTPETPPQRIDWRKSITRQAVTCLACGASFKQLSVRHLQDHGLDGRSYRAKYGIPRTQPLTARAMTVMRRKMAQETNLWEKAPRRKRNLLIRAE